MQAEIKHGLTRALSHLQYIDPYELWGVVQLARQHGEDPDFWREVYELLIAQGTSMKYAKRWVDGLKALATGKEPPHGSGG